MGLLEFLQRDADARLIFGKRELQIIRKQLLGEKLKQSERNRLSKFIRPKLRFMRSCVTFADEFELKRKHRLKSLVQKTIRLMLRDKLAKKISAILLFGSHAENLPTYRSDIDICAIFDEINPKEAAEFRIRTMANLPDIVDVQVFNVLPIWVKLGIAQNFKILFKRKNFDEDFWIQTIKLASESRAMELHETQ